MGKKYINKDIVVREDIQIAMSTFTPRFGNQQDIDITNKYTDLVNLLSLQKKDEERRKKLKEITKTNSARKKQIEKIEERILGLLNNN